jgi:tripartite-type tricarboxylate transporter receptor subunit TctC
VARVINPKEQMKSLISALLCAAVLTAPAGAQVFPSKSVRFIVPQAPGGATDVFARLVGQRLTTRWGQQVVVENRAGAAGVVGTDLVAKSPADGYTLLVTYAGAQAINQSLYAKIPFDSVKDFQPIATLAVTPFFLVAGPKLQAKDFKELVASAKAKPGVITYASSGNGSINHLLGEMLKTEAAFDIVHIPYKGVAAAIGDVLGGQVDVAFTSVPSVIQHIRSGKLRALAVSSAKRNATAPDVPAISELGLPAFDVNPWWGVLAPAATPRPIIDKLNAEIADVLKADDVQAFFKAQGAETLVTTSEVFMRMLEDDVRKWARVVKSSGARID